MQEWFIFYPIAKDPDHGVKIRQNLDFSFLLAFLIYLSGYLFSFSKIPVTKSSGILSLGNPYKNYIKYYNLSVIGRSTIRKEHLYGNFCE